jgi:hypothetical protein
MFIAGVIIIAIGCLLIALTVALARRAGVQASWPQIPGVITRSRVTHGPDIDADIEYEYVHRGRKWTSTTVKSNEVSVNWPGPARHMADKYPVGASVTVFVNPGNPMSAVLEPGGDGHFMPFMMTVGAVMILIGALLMLRS